MIIPVIGKRYWFWSGYVISSGLYVWDHTTGNPVVRDRNGNLLEVPVEQLFYTYGDAVDNDPRLKNKKPK